jgi:hypothetical protein
VSSAVKTRINPQLCHLLGCYTAAYAIRIEGAEGAPLLNPVGIEEDECRGEAEIETITYFASYRVMNV